MPTAHSMALFRLASQTKKLFIVCACCVVLSFYAPSSLAGNPVSPEDVVVVVQKGAAPNPPPVSRYVLAAIFGMRLTSWPDGSAIRVFVLPDDNPVHSHFCKQVLRVFPHQLRTAWDRMVYSGTGQSPELVNSEKEMKMRVANTPGAIGYVTKEMLDDSVAILPVE